MGCHSFFCPLGLPSHDLDIHAMKLEGEGHELEHAARHGRFDSTKAFAVFHEAVDAAQDGDRAGALRSLDAGLKLLDDAADAAREVQDRIEAIGGLFTEKITTDPDDLLARREEVFGELDYDAIYASIDRSGAAFGARSLWSEMVTAIRTGGARAGLAVTRERAREVERAIRARREELGTLADAETDLDTMAEVLHSQTVPSHAITIAWFRLEQQTAYLSIVCDIARERLEEGGEVDILPLLAADHARRATVS